MMTALESAAADVLRWQEICANRKSKFQHLQYERHLMTSYVYYVYTSHMQFHVNFIFNFSVTYLQHPISFRALELAAARGVPVHDRKSSSDNEGPATVPQK